MVSKHPLKWFFSILLSIVIVVLSTIPVPEVPELEDVPFFDKWVHFVMYGSLTFAMWFDRWRGKGWSMPTFSFMACSFIYPSLLGGLMELVQAYLTSCRSGDWIDFVADVFGAALAIIISYSAWKIAERISAVR